MFVHVRGVWIPTDEEVEELMEPTSGVGSRWLYYVRDRGPEVRILLGFKDQPNPFKAGEPFFAELYAEVRKDGKSLRRTVRLYEDNRGVYREQLAQGKHTPLDLDYLCRELSAFEVRRKVYISEGLTRTCYLSEEDDCETSTDSVMPSKEAGGFLVTVGQEKKQARNLEDACKLADWMTHTQPQFDYGDWRLTKANRR